MSSRITRLISRLTAAAAAIVLGGTVIATATPASAAARDGVCDSGEFCYYYNSNHTGSLSDFTGSLDDYGTEQPSCYEFKSAGAGQGLCIKNEAASAWNRSSTTVRVHYNSGYAGSYQDLAPGAKVNLNATLKNQNASHRFLASGPTGCTTDGTHSRLPTTILVHRVSLGRVDRVDFKTYVKNVLPNEWVPSWPAESLKAGAMAVKSFGWHWALTSTRKTSWGECYDVRDDTASQVYRPGSATAATSAAVDATWNTRMTRDGKILQAHYCATTTACGAWVSGDWMSQYGSRDKANAGQNHLTILKAYYTRIVLS
ncbi:SpoIID/LytB domain-containing protein [Actinocorallia populi]|uniref:SpoIID/LytB domain-containing protein n=1 Tax=Actinocorallia populi TaxID=2079200 RepID=UPI0018E50982|nr:SpoIID/LytB domain-containing protein [Actinocorallia populi]